MSSGTADALGLSRAILCNGESPPPSQFWPRGSQARASRRRALWPSTKPCGSRCPGPWPLPIGLIVTISLYPWRPPYPESVHRGQLSLLQPVSPHLQARIHRPRSQMRETPRGEVPPSSSPSLRIHRCAQLLSPGLRPYPSSTLCPDLTPLLYLACPSALAFLQEVTLLPLSQPVLPRAGGGRPASPRGNAMYTHIHTHTCVCTRSPPRVPNETLGSAPTITSPSL